MSERTSWDGEEGSPPPGRRPVPAAVVAAGAGAACISATAVADTVNDGPDPHWPPQVLALLARHRVQATFSLIGRQAHAHSDLARQILAEGHGICNHHDPPAHYRPRHPSRIGRQVEDGQSAIVDTTGDVPRLFRAPAGAWSPTVLQTAARNGMVPIDWNVDLRDWSRPGTAHIVRRMLVVRHWAHPGSPWVCG